MIRTGASRLGPAQDGPIFPPLLQRDAIRQPGFIGHRRMILLVTMGQSEFFQKRVKANYSQKGSGKTGLKKRLPPFLQAPEHHFAEGFPVAAGSIAPAQRARRRGDSPVRQNQRFSPSRAAEWSAPAENLPARGFVQRGAAVVAWDRGTAAKARSPFRIVGAHTDSPCLRIKPNPDTGGFGWKQLAVEVYGGALLTSWLDRDLGLAFNFDHRRIL